MKKLKVGSRGVFLEPLPRIAKRCKVGNRRTSLFLDVGNINLIGLGGKVAIPIQSMYGSLYLHLGLIFQW